MVDAGEIEPRQHLGIAEDLLLDVPFRDPFLVGLDQFDVFGKPFLKAGQPIARPSTAVKWRDPGDLLISTADHMSSHGPPRLPAKGLVVKPQQVRLAITLSRQMLVIGNPHRRRQTCPQQGIKKRSAVGQMPSRDHRPKGTVQVRKRTIPGHQPRFQPAADRFHLDLSPEVPLPVGVHPKVSLHIGRSDAQDNRGPQSRLRARDADRPGASVALGMALHLKHRQGLADGGGMNSVQLGEHLGSRQRLPRRVFSIPNFGPDHLDQATAIHLGGQRLHPRSRPSRPGSRTLPRL